MSEADLENALKVKTGISGCVRVILYDKLVYFPDKRKCYETWSKIVADDSDLKFRDLGVVYGEPGTKTERLLALMQETFPGMTQAEFTDISESLTHNK